MTGTPTCATVAVLGKDDFLRWAYLCIRSELASSSRGMLLIDMASPIRLRYGHRNAVSCMGTAPRDAIRNSEVHLSHGSRRFGPKGGAGA
jgi:hypothetical protein